MSTQYKSEFQQLLEEALRAKPDIAGLGSPGTKINMTTVTDLSCRAISSSLHGCPPCKKAITTFDERDKEI